MHRVEQPAWPGQGGGGMCFSAEADLVGGVVVGTLGIDAFSHVRVPRERLVAAVPIVLAVHQLIEILVWKGLEGEVSHSVWRTALVAYAVIAFAVVPVLVPLAVAALEPGPNRPRVLVLAAVGAGVAVVLLRAIARGPIEASIVGHHIAYYLDLSSAAGIVIALYVVATCGSLLLSSHARVRWYGVANLIVVGMLTWLDQSAFVSLWCAWAAFTSLAIAWHLRQADTAPPGPPAIEFS
jgi:hypothetical protein